MKSMMQALKWLKMYANRYINAIAGPVFVAFFVFVTYSLWGDAGMHVNLLSYPVYVYHLMWAWIALIAFTVGMNCVNRQGNKISAGLVFSGWWVMNIVMIEILQYIKPRGIGESGGEIDGLATIQYDFIAQAFVDSIALLLIFALIKHSKVIANIWVYAICVFLVANLIGHTNGAFQVLINSSYVELIAGAYDSYMYLLQTAILLILSTGAAVDGWLRLANRNVDINRDIRPVVRSIVGRYIHY